MGEKLYRPILKDGDHLVKSKKNEGRVRGVSQDKNNKNPDIIEWEEVDDSIYNYSDEQYESERIELTPEQQEKAQFIGEIVAAFVIYEAEQLNKRVISPWWEKNAKPWLKTKLSDAKQIFSGKTKAETLLMEQHEPSTIKQATDNIEVMNQVQIDELLDSEFESIQFGMDSEEVKTHMIKLIYHMLGAAYEIKILSNTRIVDQIEDETIQIEKKKQVEKLLAERVASNIDELLKDENLLLEVSSSKQIFNLLGGGIRIGGEYVPVEREKVDAAINSMKVVSNEL